MNLYASAVMPCHLQRSEELAEAIVYGCEQGCIVSVNNLVVKRQENLNLKQCVLQSGSSDEVSSDPHSPTSKGENRVPLVSSTIWKGKTELVTFFWTLHSRR
jgi:hypothetical protein